MVIWQQLSPDLSVHGECCQALFLNFPLWPLSLYKNHRRDSRVQRSGEGGWTEVFQGWDSFSLIVQSNGSANERSEYHRQEVNWSWRSSRLCTSTCTDTYSMYKKRRLQAGGVPSNTKRHLGLCHLLWITGLVLINSLSASIKTLSLIYPKKLNQ